MIVPAKKGPDVGKDHTQLSDESLAWWSENAMKADLKAACAEEQKRRAAGGKPASASAQQQPPATQPPPATASQAVATRSSTDIISGTFRDARKATEVLMHAQQVAHLVAPATVCATLPEGCEVALAAVVVDVEHETYKISDKLGLGKTALERIAAAAGVSWDPVLSQRLDDASEPRYCHFRAVGYVRGFDGQMLTRSGEVEIDARDGSPQIEEILTKAKKNNRDPSAQILELRKFLLRHAESKAKNRAIRSLGVRTSYEPKELAKPFVVAKLMFTGQSDDPEARREFRGMIAQSFLGATNAMYGVPQSVAAALPAPAHRPPEVGAVVHDDDDDTFEITATQGAETSGPTEAPHSEPSRTTNDPAALLRPRVAELLKTDAGQAAFDRLFGDQVLAEELSVRQIGELLDLVAAGEAAAGGTRRTGTEEQPELKL